MYLKYPQFEFNLAAEPIVYSRVDQPPFIGTDYAPNPDEWLAFETFETIIEMILEIPSRLITFVEIVARLACHFVHR